MKAVIKLGGSLQDSQSLRRICETIDKMSKRNTLVVVPGGGRFADQVHTFQEDQNLSDKTAHTMAILGMEIYGYGLGDLMEDMEYINGLDEDEFESGGILLPFELVNEKCNLEKSWRITSDSLAAWICGELAFKNLILVKSVDGIPEEDPSSQMTVKELKATEQSVVDQKFPDIIERNELTAWIVNGEYPDRIKRLIDGEETVSTRVVLR